MIKLQKILSLISLLPIMILMGLLSFFKILTAYEIFMAICLAVIFCITTYMLGKYLIINPLRELVDMMKNIDNFPHSSSTSKFTITEITELKEIFYNMVENISSKHNIITQQIQELEQSNQDLQNFAYIASHDLQEPLRKIEAFSNRFVKSIDFELNEKSKDSLDRILSAVNRMRALLNDLLKLSRVNSISKNFEMTPLVVIIDVVKDDLSELIGNTNTKIVTNKLPTLPIIRTLMKELFQNLISNSIKFKKENVDLIIEISAENFMKYSIIHVKDNGIGFDKKYENQIFDSFFRLHSVELYPGTGMGLSIVKRIISHHNGEIWVNSNEGIGTTFSFKLWSKNHE